MKYLGFLLLLLSPLAHGSFTPVSGTFSNAGGDTAAYGFNLVVTVTGKGQQFFLQCFRDRMPAFGTVTIFRRPKIEAVLNAGRDCPEKKLRIRLDYEEAYIEVNGQWTPLPRRDIVIPIVD
ncbi:hypothetical protein [Massilia sp. HP4]|uniref:hypothetical protein n=1 Tax=Massilia sp. HP4 TaxID=2562316 RepID=UPI0010C0EDA8|nr:hypothetical protein [Massilia sp. HP4]